MKTLPEGDSSVAQGPGANNKGPGLSGLQPETTLGRDKWIPLEGGSNPTATSGGPEVPDILRNMLRQASVSEEHRTLMGMVVERVLSAKSGLTEACTSLLRGFEVCTVKCLIVFYSQTAPVYR